MAICTVKDADIKQVSEGKDKLKDLMTGGIDKLGDMGDIQTKMNDGINNFNTAATGPTEVCTCQGGTNFLASTQSECEEGGGTWTCKVVEKFNLQEELLSLNNFSNPIDFASGVQSIKEKFGDVVPDLNEKVGAASPALGDFFKNFKMPSLPKAGDKVQSCVCQGGTNFTASTEAECIAGGGTWVCQETTLGSNFGLPGGFGSGGTSEFGSLNDWGSQIQGGAGSVKDFFGGASATKIPDGATIPSFPKQGEIVEICDCSIAGYYTKEECEGNQGVWTCRTGAAPAIPNIFGSDGLPKLSQETLCNNVENIETNEVLSTDPQTGITSILKVADNLPKEPVVPKAPPAPPAPAPTTDNTKNNQSGGAGAAFLYTQGMIRTTLHNILKKVNIDNDYFFDMTWWGYKDLIWEKGGEGSFDTSSNPFWYKNKNPKIDKEEAEKRFKEYAAIFKREKGKDPKSKNIDDMKARLWTTFVAKYTEQERYWNKGEPTTYAGEEGLIKWIKETFEEVADSRQETKATTVVETAVEKEVTPAPEGATVAEVKPVETPALTEQEIEEVPELTGTQTVTTKAKNGGKVISYNADVWKVGAIRVQVHFRHKQTKTNFFAGSQEEFDTLVRVYNTKKIETYKFSNDSIGRKPSGGWNISVVYYDIEKNHVVTRIVWKYGLSPKKQERENKKYESGETNKLVSKLGGDWNQIEGMILEVVMNAN